MAGKVVSYTLNWFNRDTQEFKQRDIAIRFCSMYIDREYPPLLHRAAAILAYARRMGEIQDAIAEERKTRTDRYIDRVDVYADELDRLTAAITDAAAIGSDDEILQKRYGLVKELLISNGITDSELLSFEFWDKCVDATTAWDLLELATNKDRGAPREKKK